MGEMADYFRDQDDRKIEEGMLPTCGVHEGKYGRWLDPMNIEEHLALVKSCKECRGDLSDHDLHEFEMLQAPIE